MDCGGIVTYYLDRLLKLLAMKRKKYKNSGKKRYTLVYRWGYPFEDGRRKFGHTTTILEDGSVVYTPNKLVQHPFDIIANKCRPDEETLKRIKRNGKFFAYTPSKDYLVAKKSGIWTRRPLEE